MSSPIVLASNPALKKTALEAEAEILKQFPYEKLEIVFTEDANNSLTAFADFMLHASPGFLMQENILHHNVKPLGYLNYRLLAVFQDDIIYKLKNNLPLKLGITHLANPMLIVSFLKNALPQYQKINFKTVEGADNKALQKQFIEQSLDGIVLSWEPENDVLENEVKWGFGKFYKMLLPQLECAVSPLERVVFMQLLKPTEKNEAIFSRIRGTVSKALFEELSGNKLLGQAIINLPEYGRVKINITKTENEGIDTEFSPMPKFHFLHKILFNSADLLGNFFDYNYPAQKMTIRDEKIFVANYKALHSGVVLEGEKEVWASGSRTWVEVAKKKIWVHGSAEAFGLEYLAGECEKIKWGISRQNVLLVTNNKAARGWEAKGWKAIGTYGVAQKAENEIEKKIAVADMVFWSSMEQYEWYQKFCKKNVLHLCAYGETAFRLKKLEKEVIVFPGIKSFQQWKQKNMHLLIVE